jgi:TolA-binding protein
MKRHLFAIALFLAAGGAWAGERSLKDWLKDLDMRLRHTEDRHKRLVAAASVRGAKQEDDGKKLYWKGRKENRPVTAEELDAFKTSVALAKDGKTAEAQAGLESFLAKFPSSPMADDAKQTLALLKEAPAPAATDAKPAEVK